MLSNITCMLPSITCMLLSIMCMLDKNVSHWDVSKKSLRDEGAITHILILNVSTFFMLYIQDLRGYRKFFIHYSIYKSLAFILRPQCVL